MIITIIAAMAENRVIGRNNEMPWDLPTERHLFKETTIGHPVIMGRRTFESIGCPLPGRKNVIITRQQGYPAPGCTVVKSLTAAIAECGFDDEIFICGGEAVFREAMMIADRVYLTIVEEEFEGDAYFPDIPDAFREVERTAFNEDVLPYEVVRYERIRNT